MTLPFDLDAYCARIGYVGERAPTLATLQAVHLAHTRSIPFENLDPLLGVTPELDAASLQAKLVQGRRGGYCFEQNILFRHALEAVGFQVTGLSARVLWNAPPDAVTARSHMVLRIDLPEGPFIADVGFGGLTLTGPLRLAPDLQQSTPHESFRLLTADGGYRLEARLGDQWTALYRFDLQAQQLIDYQVANWYVATHPRSLFVNGLMAARPDTDRRYALRGAELAVYHRGGRVERHTLTDSAALRDALAGPLGIALPDHPRLDAALARIAAPNNARS